jgi:predicted GIY-YIG superfamily endonuclease
VFDPVRRGDSKAIQTFVQASGVRETVAVVSLVKPWDRHKFVTHLCLSLGTYTTENDIFCSRDMKAAFYNCGLLQSATSDVTRADILSILKKYVVVDLAFHPISARQFARYLKAAEDTLTAVLVNGVLGDYTPCLSEVMLKEQATELVIHKEGTRKQRLLAGLADDVAVRDLLPPDLDVATIDRPLSWIPSIVQVDGISDEAFGEQSAALALCVRAVDTFLQPACCGVKFPCLVGRPGSGKSHVLKIATAYAMSRGLCVELMSWTSERARKLGGNHLHLVFPLPVSKGSVTFSHGIATDCLGRIRRDPVKMLMLKRTDVFVFEEIGMLSAEYFAALDNILRVTMGNSLPWGGKLLMCCGDAKQLPPIEGRPVWACTNMCTMMDVYVFTADVRARDPHLQWLNDKCRRQLSNDDCEAVAEVVLRECRFEQTWANVPELAVRIVSTKAAEQQVLDEFLASKQTKAFVARDEVQNGAVWQAAGPRITKRLNKNLYEYDVCRLYKNAIVRMTYNEKHGLHQFSQGQVAVVVDLPEDDVDVASRRLRLRLAPPGIRNIDIHNIPAEWPEVVVGVRTTPPSIVGPCLQMGRRTQFPVRYYFCTTIHRIQGDTVPLLATQLSNSERQYRLWQKEQFVVLISRVQRCRDVIFVGSAAETRNAIVRILGRSSKWDVLVDQYLTALNVAARPAAVREISLDSHPFLPLYRELPTAVCGYVYMLASVSCAGKFYIGETNDLKRCLRQHNTGYGSEQTRDTALHPWGIFAFVVGFESSNSAAARDSKARICRRVDWCKCCI